MYVCIFGTFQDRKTIKNPVWKQFLTLKYSVNCKESNAIDWVWPHCENMYRFLRYDGECKKKCNVNTL